MAFSLAIASASVIAIAAGFPALSLRFVSEAMSRLVGGAAQARARSRKDTIARDFFMIVTPDRMLWCSAAVLCQLLGLVKERVAQQKLNDQAQRLPLGPECQTRC